MMRFILILITLFLSLDNCICQKDTIKIGLLIQDKNSKAAQEGAELAIRQANLKEQKKFFVLAVRNMEGPWGTGSRMAVDLVFNQKVWALIGSVDGRNSHLAEMVSAKTRIPFLSAWSGDPTLAYAFIPWFFSCVPNDQQKAASILDHLHSKNTSLKTAVVTAKDYDSESGSKNFMQSALEKGISKPVLFRFDKISSFDSIRQALKKMVVNDIVFFGPVSDLLEFRKNIQTGNCRVFCISSADGENAVKTSKLEGVTFISPGYLFTANGKKFISEFSETFGHRPGDASAFAYDMTNIVINSINVSVNDRDSLKNYLRKTDFEGVTGRIGFDEKGRRQGEVQMMRVKNGEFVIEE